MSDGFIIVYFESAILKVVEGNEVSDFEKIFAGLKEKRSVTSLQFQVREGKSLKTGKCKKF